MRGGEGGPELPECESDGSGVGGLVGPGGCVESPSPANPRLRADALGWSFRAASSMALVAEALLVPGVMLSLLLQTMRA